MDRIKALEEYVKTLEGEIEELWEAIETLQNGGE